jgi:hypothetical protein
MSPAGYCNLPLVQQYLPLLISLQLEGQTLVTETIVHSTGQLAHELVGAIHLLLFPTP